jgi:UDP-N-acetylglucosamine:LPS N-acetylglucosamine transferase
MEEHNISLKALFEKVLKIEEHLSLLDWKIDGIYIWEVIRYQVFNEILRKKSLFGVAHASKINNIDKIVALPTFAYNSITKNPLIGKKVDVLIFDHPRKVKVGNDYIDIYTEYLAQDLENKGQSFEIIEEDYLKEHFASTFLNKRKYLDSYFFHTLLLKVKLKKDMGFFSHKEFIRKVDLRLKHEFRVNLNLEKMIQEELMKFKLKYKYYYDILKKKKPKQIFIVVGYTHTFIIKAAKDLGIKCIEIQHGVISEYHLGYRYSEPKKVTYFSDSLYTFGEYWTKNMTLPDYCKIEEYGFGYLNNQLNNYIYSSKKKQIVFISQGTIGKSLSEIAVKIAKQHNDYEVIYKLHPGEYNIWKKEYKKLFEAEKCMNLKIIDNNDVPLYKILSESIIQVGVYSTALYEGIALGCKTFLYSTYGVEYLEDLLNNKVAFSFNNSDGLSNLINQMESLEFKSITFFKGIQSNVNN